MATWVFTVDFENVKFWFTTNISVVSGSIHIKTGTKFKVFSLSVYEMALDDFLINVLKSGENVQKRE